MLKQKVKSIYIKVLGKLLKPFLRQYMSEYIGDYLRFFYSERHTTLKGTNFLKHYRAFLNHNIEVVDYDVAEDLMFVKKDNLYLATTASYAFIVKEIFCMHIYFINPKYFKRSDYIVFDLGMNRGYASVYFASHHWCKEVYGFELNEDTFKMAQMNVDLNSALKHKIKLFNYGLSDQDETLKTYYLPHRDGICSTSKEFLLQYAPEEMDSVVEVDSMVKKSSVVFKDMVETNSIQHIIMKIDVEGAEYKIFADIISEYPALLEKIDIIIGEAHMGLEPLAAQLAPFGFKDVATKKFNAKTSDFLFVKA